MKYLLILALLFGAYQYYTTRPQPDADLSSAMQPSGPYVAVYGRDRCSITNQTKAFLSEHNIAFSYFNIDDKKVKASLQQRMNDQGISTQHYNLPVVDFSGKLKVRPSNKEILRETKS